MNGSIENEMKRLEALQANYASINAAVVQARETIIRCHRQIGEARVAAVIDPEANSPKTTESLCKKLDAEMKAAEAEISKLTPEAEALSGAIARIEGQIIPKRHAERVTKQYAIRKRYAAIAARLLEAVNALAALSAEAKSIYDGAFAAYPKDESLEGQDVVRRYAGLAPIWDEQWISYGNGSRRDVIVNAVWLFDRTLVSASDPVAISNQHQEDFFRQESERQNRERNRNWTNRPPEGRQGAGYLHGALRHPLGLPL